MTEQNQRLRSFGMFLRAMPRRIIARFRRDLRFQIALYSLLFVVPVVGVVFFFGQRINDRLRSDVMAADAALAHSPESSRASAEKASWRSHSKRMDQRRRRKKNPAPANAASRPVAAGSGTVLTRRALTLRASFN